MPRVYRLRWRRSVRGPVPGHRIVAAVGLALLAAGPAGAGVPAIEITSVPAYGALGSLEGVVTGVVPADHRVAGYIQIEGAGWWTKPTDSMRVVPIDPDGTFTLDVTTGGAASLDPRATILCAALVEATHTPPLVLGGERIPADLESLALDCRERYARTVSFAGYLWGVKESGDFGVGPNGNFFSDHVDDVFVDAAGLHLGVQERAGLWRAVELILLESLGHGTYLFQTDSELDDLDPNLTFGAFTWDPHGDDGTIPGWPNREIDFEDGRWGNAGDPQNTQFVVQPYYVPGNLLRYTLPDLAADARLTRFFTWNPAQIAFTALRGHHGATGFPPGDVIAQLVYDHEPGADHLVPPAGRERFRFNLWLNQTPTGSPPAPPPPTSGQPVEVVISDFDFVPLPEPGVLGQALTGLLTLLLLHRRKR